MARPEAVLFDFDGVLADTEPLHWEAWNAALASFGIRVEWEAYQQFIGVPDREFARYAGRLFKPLRGEDEILSLYALKKEHFCNRTRNGGVITPGTVDLLKRLKNSELGVVTSSGRSEIEPILRADNVLPLFSVIVYGEDVTNLKPDPEPYRLALNRLGVGTAVVFEDSDAGVLSAEAAGCKAVRVRSVKDVPGLVKQYILDFR